MKRDYHILSGSALKLLAIVSMLADHLAAFLWRDAAWCTAPLFAVGARPVSAYVMLRLFGRIAFPLFAFLLVEGFLHTGDRRRYGIRLAVFALLSEIPWNLVHGGGWLYPTQNVFFTLLLGYLGLCALDKWAGGSRLLLPLLGLLLASILCKVDYGCSGFGFILLLYLLRSREIARAIVGSCVLGSRWVAGLAFIPIALYNGKRGFVKGPVAKYFFYLFYPLHLLVIYFLS